MVSKARWSENLIDHWLEGSHPSAMKRSLGCLLGLAVGDAVGTTVEFAQPGTFVPVTDMVGGGPFHLNAGEWTDDTSMALCLAESLIECRGFNPRDQMERYCRWWREGHLSSNGSCFDIGMTVRSALGSFEITGNPISGSTAPETAGNGSIMRMAPIPIFAQRSLEETVKLCRESSRTTHGAEECLDSCQVMGALIHHLLNSVPKDDALERIRSEKVQSRRVQQIIEGTYRDKVAGEVCGSGYVIHTLEAAIWSFEQTSNFRDAVVTAVNLGDDADTVGAVCGQIAGACYGADGIPGEWVEKIARRDLIESFAAALSTETGDRK
jgi:ADP-ribosyl-[dinitrogen reductase] hydrolase